jgi:hypothetical protein
MQNLKKYRIKFQIGNKARKVNTSGGERIKNEMVGVKEKTKNRETKVENKKQK